MRKIFPFSRLCEEIENKNLDIKQIAELLEITPSQMFNLVNGKRMFGIEKMVKLKEILGVSMDELFYEDYINKIRK